jgi:S1-C subfamily serine protease
MRLNDPRPFMVGRAMLEWLVVASMFWACLTGEARAAPPSSTESKDVDAAQNLGVAFASVAEQVSPSVVSIRVAAPIRGRIFDLRFLGPHFEVPSVVRGQGSGVVFRSNGYILTNRHVVEGARGIEVRLHDDRMFPARVVGTDDATDLAVLKIDAEHLRPALFASRDSVRAGEWVLAIGSPFGLDYTVTAGVVSAVGRGGLGVNEIEDYVQTDASINPGNSGGPLVDLRGRVVGINTLIAGPGTGIGFAIPADLAQRVADEIARTGRVRRAWLGVGLEELSPARAAALRVAPTHGLLVDSVVSSGPAARAGIREGDVIVSVGGATVSDARRLQDRVALHPVGTELTVEVFRNGVRRTFVVTTGERPERSETRARSDRW